LTTTVKEVTVYKTFNHSRKLISSRAFTKDRIGASNSIKRAIQNLVDNADFSEVSKIDLNTRYGHRGRAYMVTNSDLLAKVRKRNIG